MTNVGRVAVIVIAAATLAAEIVAFAAYRNNSDGQVGVLLLVILVYAVLGAVAVVGIDAVARLIRRRSSRFANHS